MPKAPAWLKVRWTIKGRIAFAFLTISAVSIALGFLTVAGANRSAQLVRLTYDQILIPNSFARAAAGDFANLRANAAHLQLLGTGAARPPRSRRRDIADFVRGRPRDRGRTRGLAADGRTRRGAAQGRGGMARPQPSPRASGGALRTGRGRREGAGGRCEDRGHGQQRQRPGLFLPQRRAEPRQP